MDSSWYFNWISSQMGASQQYARDSYNRALGYLSNFNNYISGEIVTDIPTINIDPVGSLNVDPIILAQLPEAPRNEDYPTPIGDVPTFVDHAFPEDPVYSLPSVPTVNDIIIPGFVSNEVVGVTSTLPEFTDEIPSIAPINDVGDVPHDSLMQAMAKKLEDNILNGGTMLDPSVEDAIWNRDLERNEQALRDAMDAMASRWAKLGWSLPDGLLAHQITVLQKEFNNKRLDRSRDIAVKQAELEQTGSFKSLELGIQLEQIVMGSHNEYAKRSLEASKSAADVTIAIFKERVNRYNASLLAYKTDVEAFKARIDAEVSRAQAYESQIKALALVSQIDETKVKIYTANVAAINTMVDIYKNKVQAVGLMYEAEKTKVERFKVQIESYVAQVDSVTKKYATSVEGFKAFIAGYGASAESQTKISELNCKAQIATVEATIKEWEIQQDLIQKNLAIRMESLKALAQIASNVAAGALAANHAGMNAAISGQAALSY